MPSHSYSLLLFAALLFSLFLAVLAAQQREKVYVDRVIDGDTMEVTDRSGRSKKVRSADIDTPERGERGSRRATEAFRDRVEGRYVELQSKGKDRYGRTVADIYDKRGHVNQDMVRDGYAREWKYGQGRRGGRR